MNFGALLVAALLSCSGARAQSGDDLLTNQTVRLAPSPLGPHAGRVEVRYNGRWGTICDQGWSYYDARVICRMLGYSGQLCAVSSATDTFGEGTGPVWLNNLRCGFNDLTLDQCSHDGLRENWCAHSRDAAVICQDDSIMPVPYNITSTSATSRSINITWMVSFIPPQIQAIDFRISYRDTSLLLPSSITYHTTVNALSTTFTYKLQNLQRNQTYEVYIRAEGEYQWCSYNELIGFNSDPVNLSTNAVVPPSTLPMRLISNNAETPYIGRLEVYHNGVWGTVCDDYFGQDEADVACHGLNYTNGAICYAYYGFPSGYGRIWLDDVDCTRQERFEDCSHRGWGVHNCGHSEDIGLICDPGYTVIPTVTNFRVTKIGHTFLILEWDPPSSFSGRYRISYQSQTASFPSTLTIYTSTTRQYTIQRLQLGANYSVQIRSELSYSGSYGGNCGYSSSSFTGEYSDPIYAVTAESAPDVSPANFHVTVLNSTAVEASWNLPTSRTGFNGRLRGFKIAVDKFNGSARVIDIPNNTTLAFIITDLESATQYTFSVLMYTVADGPESIHLRVVMPDLDFTPTITQFGIYGNGIERVIKYTYNSGFNVLCSSSVANSVVYWQFANGSQIGTNNHGFQEGRFENGTAVLQVGTALITPRFLTVCDGGIYTCVAISPYGGVSKRNFSLLIGSSPPSPNRPYPINEGSTWVQIGWSALQCDGGYQINAYDVQLRRLRYYSSYSTVARVSKRSYTFRNLAPSTGYYFRVVAVSSVSVGTGYSSALLATTHPAGPSPPRNVSVRVTSSPEVYITWSPPALPRGGVVLYNVYAEPVNASRDIVNAVDLPVQVSWIFSSFVHGGNMAVKETNAVYQFRMSAVAWIRGREVEGDLSEVTAQSFVLVPKPGLPQIKRLVSTITNTSAALQWNVPYYLEDTASFKVSYSGIVQWTSNDGVFIQFPESGQFTTTNTSITISPLTPSTSYVFKVSIITTKGEGAEVMVENTTEREIGEKLTYFQLQIFNNKGCEEWHDGDSDKTLAELQQFLATILNSQCKCDVTPSHISEGEFSCRSGSDDSINYRARIKGTNSRSASDLVALVQSWVQSGQASVVVDSTRYNIDQSCNASLDNIHALDCGSQPLTPTPPPQPPTEPPSQSVSKPSPQQSPSKEPSVGGRDNSEDVNSAEVGGIIFGGVIAGIFLALIIVFIAVLIMLKKNRNPKPTLMFSELVNEPSTSQSSALPYDEKTNESL